MKNLYFIQIESPFIPACSENILENFDPEIKNLAKGSINLF